VSKMKEETRNGLNYEPGRRLLLWKGKFSIGKKKEREHFSMSGCREFFEKVKTCRYYLPLQREHTCFKRRSDAEGFQPIPPALQGQFSPGIQQGLNCRLATGLKNLIKKGKKEENSGKFIGEGKSKAHIGYPRIKGWLGIWGTTDCN